MKFFTKDAATLAAWAGVIVAAVGIWLTLIQFIEQREQFEQSINVQNRQFLQQEKRLQRQRYTELVDILWSEKDGKPAYNEKLRTEALKEFLETEWLSELNLSTKSTNAKLQHITLDNVNWPKSTFSNSDMTKSTINNSNLSGADFEDTILNNSTIDYSDFINSNFSGAKFNSATLFDVNFTAANLFLADFSGVNKHRAMTGRINFSNARLTHASFRNANLFNSTFTNTEMCYVLWSGANLEDANLKNAKFKCGKDRANIRGVRNLTCKQLKEAIDWQYAYRDEEHACGASIPD